MKHHLSFDVEDVYQGFKERGIRGWTKDVDGEKKRINEILDLLEKYNQKATFFILTEVLKDYKQEVLDMKSRGHEVASHGHEHLRIWRRNPKEFSEDIKQSKDLLESLISKEVNSGKTYVFAKADPTYEEVRKMAEELSNMFMTGEVGKVYVAYNSFLSAIAFDSKVKQLLPMQVSEQVKEEIKTKYPYDFKYDPSADQILDTLVPEVYLTTVYTCILDAIASEHGSRMNAMENASKNSKEVIKKLSLKMNKLRQARITTELIEVVSGAESLNG